MVLKKNFHWKEHSFCFILNKMDDIVKLAVEKTCENAQSYLPAGVTGAFEISGKTPGCCICKLKRKSTSAYALPTCM